MYQNFDNSGHDCYYCLRETATQ